MLLKNRDIAPSTDAQTLRVIIEEQLKDLPTLPVVVAKILQTASSPRASARDLQALISVDGGLTAKILRLANSSFYGRQRRITTLTDAVLVLGFNTVRNLALSASMLDSLAPRGAAQVFDWRAYWEHCTAVALLCRMLARRKGLPAGGVEEAFVAGLLHDIGKLFLGKYCPELLAEVVLTAETYRLSMGEAEWMLMGTTHALLGQTIAERWNFPDTLASAIGAHHEPDAWKGDPALAYIVHGANVLAQWGGIGVVDAARPRLDPEVDAWLALTTVEREDLLEQLRDEMATTHALLGWEAGDAQGPAAEDAARPVNLPSGAAAGAETDLSVAVAAEGVAGIVHEKALVIAASSTIAAIRSLLAEGAAALVPVWGSVLFLWDDDAHRFAAHPSDGGNELLCRIGEQQMRESLLDAVLGRETVAAGPVVVAAPRALRALAADHRFLACTLRSGQKTLGFLLLGQPAREAAPDAARAEALGVLAGHAAAGVLRVQGFRASVGALAAAIDARDPNRVGHSGRVHDLAVACARKMGLSEPRVETLATAALLHDVGKIAVPEHILNKPGRLEPAEFENVAAHATSGAHLAGHSFGEVMPFILCHHERWDGSGYPAGLRGEQIPMESQILAVCEAWDAMRAGHSYRPASTTADARRELQAGCGTQFNPAVVAAFLGVVPEDDAPGGAAAAAAAARAGASDGRR
jgi:putative nucleotidyltransferase with HDIG domain